MKIIAPPLQASLQAARDGGIKPVWFAWFTARNRATGATETMGLWTGDEDITLSVETPEGGLASRQYLGGCNLHISGLQYVLDLTDNPVTISMSQIADATQALVRGYDVRLAEVVVHSTTMTGGAFTAAPEIAGIYIVDEAGIQTPSFGNDGSISLSARSEIMHQLTATNPAKSSHEHQKRRKASDEFSKYGGTIESWPIQWYKKG